MTTELILGDGNSHQTFTSRNLHNVNTDFTEEGRSVYLCIDGSEKVVDPIAKIILYITAKLNSK